MSPDAWTFMGLIVTNLGALSAIALQNRKSSRSLHRKVEPVSNGFAKEVTSALSRIERRLDDHMRGHK